ncbi:hypothetical protein PY650_16340 [Rhizobium calliandrae]|uniref:Uncharacterized protein n=1 Tax=Rhizobium calliandrae TaxID=1312182 RepID=A0ABT7KG85_9HYPH|nr:hypothetical protein [Rhizobium calliandrae]MDL2407207.1 hypothetical protein [Rhizobium calliandrae]
MEEQALNAAQDQIKDKLYINFSSGTGGAPAAIKMTPTPEYVDDSVNPRLLDLFSEAARAIASYQWSFPSIAQAG